MSTTLIGALIGTVGKRQYDDWQRRRWLARQLEIRDELRTFGCAVGMSDDGRVISVILRTVHVGKAMALVTEATELEQFDVECPFTDYEVAMLAQHSKLRQLNIGGSEITPSSLIVIGKLDALERLSIANARVADDDLIHLRNLKNLRVFAMGGSKLRGPGLAYVCNPNLHTLMFRDCLIDDDGLAAVADFRGLVNLYLLETKVKGPGLAHLAELRDLRYLYLMDSNISDGTELAKLDQLTTVDLSGARLGPGVVEHLQRMDRLQVLRAEGIHVPDEDRPELTALQDTLKERVIRASNYKK